MNELEEIKVSSVPNGILSAPYKVEDFTTHETNETILDPENTGIIRDEEGKFVKGISGNPAGKPKGTVSVITTLKRMFEDDPQSFKDFVKTYKENPDNQKHIVEMIDGKPKQSMDLAVKELPIIEISETIINKHDTETK